MRTLYALKKHAASLYERGVHSENLAAIKAECAGHDGEAYYISIQISYIEQEKRKEARGW